MKFSLGPVSWSLANTDGTIYKSVKSKLLQCIEKEIPLLAEAPADSTLIFDGMCVIQQLPSGLETFGTISEFVLKRITANQANEVMFITDQYFETSIKGGERERRVKAGRLRITASRPEQSAPKQFRKYLSVGVNKTELLKFLLKDWCHQRHASTIGNKIIFFTLKDEGYQICNVDDDICCLRVPQLASKQEEADTKMFLAASYASSRGSNSVTIQTVDSDVAILGCYFAPSIGTELYVNIGTGKYERLLNVSQAQFEGKLSRALPRLHAFSGCDSTSAFHSIGKVKWLNLVLSNEIFRDALALLGEDLSIQDTIFEAIEQLVCTAYGFESETDIDRVRYKKCCGKKFPEPSRLPPTKDELKQHIKRANYQTFIWKNALQRDCQIPNASDHGWKLEDGCLKVHWMDNQPAPDEILELVVCNCKRGKCNEECQCIQLQVACTDICKCKSECVNKTEIECEDSDDEEFDEMNDEDLE